MATMTQENGHITGTKDKELAEFFRKAQTESRKGAEQGKKLMAARLR